MNHAIIDKGIDAATGLPRKVQFTGEILINLEDDNPDNPNNAINVQYREFLVSPNGQEIEVKRAYYTEYGERATRWFTNKIPGTEIRIGTDVVIPAINEYLTENLQ